MQPTTKYSMQNTHRDIEANLNNGKIELDEEKKDSK